jgi:NAD(P)-dependent dehydrogenase (short-subunit alcohol dehydrogenase family)
MEFDMADNIRAKGGLQGHAVLVTGGGTGIGMACAARLAADGAAVTITGRRESVLGVAADKIGRLADHGGSVSLVAGDITVEADVARMVEHALQATGKLNGCVANAGGGGAPAPYDKMDTDEFMRVLNLNVLGTMLSVKYCLPHMVAAGGGSFVAMSSLASHITHPWFGAYCVGKAGVDAMMRNCADENGCHGVRFNAIRPGFIATEIMEGIPRDSDVYRSYIDNTPLGDAGEPDDVAQLARFLIGPESRWITGQTINVDGGHSLRRGPDFSPWVG